MRVHAFGGTDVGQLRGHNEDFFLSIPALNLHVVCDGMGGHAAGEVASEMAARVFVSYIEEHKDVLDAYDDSPKDREKILELMRHAGEEASRRVYDHACTDHGRAGMGTTLVALLMIKDKGVMAHVGDSRVYMLRAGKLHQLSIDHNYAMEMIGHGLDPEKAYASAFAARLTRAVGIQATTQVDTLLFDVLPGDTYLLCSDGLSGYFESDKERAQLAELLAGENKKNLPAKLIKIANARGGEDNITAVVLSAEEEAEHAVEDARRTSEINKQINVLRFVYLFKNLTLRETIAVLSRLRAIEYAAGFNVIVEGERDDRLFILLDGELEVRREGLKVATLKGGAHFGEMALVSKRPRSATVVATKLARMLVMERRDFELILHKVPTLGIKLMMAFAQVLSERLDETTLLINHNKSIED